MTARKIRRAKQCLWLRTVLVLMAATKMRLLQKLELKGVLVPVMILNKWRKWKIPPHE
ncbi:hypothetical protein [Microbulbifer sp. 2205BS26-8]|uniref:hypothetical protein n=1 Tax=Microbulbifer sp. 2205BS26-8 TaxID=3064386 RepID=UPI00273F65E6|nr:hypothetical protein [Microbulbifer sp. 2205BS26-8]MDP5208964.1 hypothetical protein [Microbulbifer sp. 2205BS26-8]